MAEEVMPVESEDPETVLPASEPVVSEEVETIEEVVLPEEPSAPQSTYAYARLENAEFKASIEGTLPENDTLKVRTLSDEEIAKTECVLPDDAHTVFYSLELESAEQPQGEATITITLPDDCAKPLAIERLLLNSEGTPEYQPLVTVPLEGTEDQDLHTYTFTTDVLGTFLLTYQDAEQVADTAAADSAAEARQTTENILAIQAEPEEVTLEAQEDDVAHAVAYINLNWQDWDDINGVRPESVNVTGSITLKNNQTYTINTTVTADEGYSKRIVLPITVDQYRAGGRWTWRTTSLDGQYTNEQRYDSSLPASHEATINLPLRTREVQVYVYWYEPTGATGTRPETLEFSATYADGTPLPEALESSHTVTVRPTESYTAASTYSAPWKMPLYDKDGNVLHYKAVLATDPIPSYLVEYGKYSPGSSPWLSDYTTYNATLDYVDYTVTKSWQDNDNDRAKRPADFVLTLLRNGEEYDVVSDSVVAIGSTVNTYTWKSLPRLDEEGNPIEWSVSENAMTLYDTIYGPTLGPDEDNQIASTVINVYRDDWNYAIDLKWDTPNADQRYDQKTITTSNSQVNLKYALNISTNSRLYEPGEMEVRLPYALWTNRDGTPNLPVDIGVPEAPGQNIQYSFNYRIDKHDSTNPEDWEIVYTNWKRLEAGTNETITVIYKVSPVNSYDLQTAEFQAVGKAKGDGATAYEEQVSPTITYQIDTGAAVSTVRKEADALQYSRTPPGGYGISGQLDVEHYNYVRWKVDFSAYGNQPYTIKVTDIPGDGGKVVGCQGSGYTIRDGILTKSINYTPTNTISGQTHYLYLIVAYPREEKPDSGDDGQDVVAPLYHNNVYVQTIANDDLNYLDPEVEDYNDFSEKSASAVKQWEDYYFDVGSVYTLRKQYGSRDTYGCSKLKAGIEVTNLSFNVDFTTNGYFLGDYQMEIFDDDLYWYYVDDPLGEPVRVTSEDAEIWRCQINVTYSDRDRSDGSYMKQTDVTQDPFIIYARVDDGEWEEIGQFKLVEGGDSVTAWAPDEALAAKSYTGIKVVSPENLKAYTGIYIYPYWRIKPTSPQLQTWMQEERDGEHKLEDITFRNFASYNLYTVRSDGKHLYNPVSNSVVDAASEIGLYDLDVDEYGRRVMHRTATETIGSVKFRDYASKYTVSITNDTLHSSVDALFNMGVCEEIQGGKDYLSDEERVTYSFDSGTFYDLLPKGWQYKPSAGVRAQGVTGVSAIVTDVQTVDNWRGSGRQMVIFKVESLAPEGTNFGTRIDNISQNHYNASSYGKMWRNTYQGSLTGFTLEFTATITWAELAFNRSGLNHVFYQDGDLREFKGSTDTVWLDEKPFKDDGLFWNAQDSSGMMTVRDLRDEEGNTFVDDINDDGVTENIDTLYARSSVNPDIAQAVEVGIIKEVRGVSGSYGHEDKAALGRQYSYRLNITTSDNGVTKDVVFYDVLENAENTEGHTGEISWQGTFNSVNTGMVENMGIAPVIYYSTTPDLNYNDIVDPAKNYGIANTDIWTTERPEDASTITAIAFDLSTGKNGEPFEFENAKQVNVEIIMDAPDDMPDNGAIYAYNRPAYSSNYVPAGSATPTFMSNIGRRVQVQIFNPQELKIIKMGQVLDSQTGEITGQAPLGGVQFDLYRCNATEEGHVHHGTPGQAGSCWGTEPLKYAISMRNGEALFDLLGAGDYAFVESFAPRTHTRASGYWTFSVDEETETVTVPEPHNGAPALGGDAEEGYVLTDSINTTAVAFIKTFSNTIGAMYPDELTFHVMGNGVLYRTVVLKASEYITKHVLENLPKYDASGQQINYSVVEPEVPDGYNMSSTYSQQRTGGVQDPYYTYTITNSATYTTLSITKTINYPTDEMKTMEFTAKVTLKDKDGNPLTGTYPVVYTANNNTSTRVEGPAEEIVLDENGQGTVPVMYGLTARIYMLPQGATYKVEEDLSSTPGWELVSGERLEGATHTAYANGARLHNEYSTSGEYTFPVIKTVNGVDPAELGYDETFTFELYYTYSTPRITPSGRPMQTVTNNGDQVEFDPRTLSYTGSSGTLMYGKSVTQYYLIREVPDASSPVTQDTTSYIARIVWQDDKEGHMVPQVDYFTDASLKNKVDAPVFRNTYAISGTAQIAATKHLDGAAAADGAFSFELVDSAGKTVETVANDGEGQVSFAPMSFNQNDIGKTYTYTIREVAGTDAKTVYDDRVYTATITPEMKKVDGEWVLDCTPVYSLGEETADQALFENWTLVDLSGTKTWVDEALQDMEGYERPESIQVTLTGTAGGREVYSDTRTVTPDEEGNWLYSWTGLDKYCDHGTEIVYTISEDVPEGFAMTEGEGTIDMTNSLKEITGAYTPCSVQVTKVDKDSPATLLAGAVFELKDEEGTVVATYTTGADGTAQVEFAEPGTYTLTETQAPAGYDNPGTVYTFEVTAIDPVAEFDVEQDAWVATYTLVVECEGLENGELKVPDPKTPAPPAANEPASRSPRTGDGTSTLPFAGLLVVGALVLCGAFAIRRREQ